jgi:hypothetical protein
MKSTIFWDITPCSPLKVNRRFGGTYCLHLQGRRISRARRLCLSPAYTLVSCAAYSTTLKMDAICSSETSVDFQRTTRCYIPEDSTLQWDYSLVKSPVYSLLTSTRKILRNGYTAMTRFRILVCGNEESHVKVRSA